ncbi:MAG: CZB domain-containing protein [Rhodospirillaceae bacterium]
MIAEIEEAIRTHRAWSRRLRVAIETSEFGQSVEDVLNDRNCEFGKWLYGDSISEVTKRQYGYHNILSHHSTFHRYAATVLSLALAGKKDEALKCMDANSEYELASTLLIHSLLAWHGDLQQQHR